MAGKTGICIASRRMATTAATAIVFFTSPVTLASVVLASIRLRCFPDTVPVFAAFGTIRAILVTLAFDCLAHISSVGRQT